MAKLHVTESISASQAVHAAPASEFAALIEATVQATLRHLDGHTLPVASQYLRTPAAARFLCLDEDTLQDFRSQPGRGPKYRKVGSRVIYAARDLIDWMESHALIDRTVRKDRLQ